MERKVYGLDPKSDLRMSIPKDYKATVPNSKIVRQNSSFGTRLMQQRRKKATPIIQELKRPEKKSIHAPTVISAPSKQVRPQSNLNMTVTSGIGEVLKQVQTPRVQQSQYTTIQAKSGSSSKQAQQSNLQGPRSSTVLGSPVKENKEETGPRFLSFGKTSCTGNEIEKKDGAYTVETCNDLCNKNEFCHVFAFKEFNSQSSQTCILYKKECKEEKQFQFTSNSMPEVIDLTMSPNTNKRDWDSSNNLAKA